MTDDMMQDDLDPMADPSLNDDEDEEVEDEELKTDDDEADMM